MMTTARLLAAAALGLGLAQSPAAAQDYPNRPIKLMIPLTPGSPVDALGRVVAQHLQTRLGQNIVIENRPGGGMSIGTRAVATAEPDGYNLLLVNTGHLYGLHLNPGYDMLKSFAPVATLVQWSHVLVTRPDFAPKTMKDTIAFAKANPNKVTFGYGVGTPPHILGAILQKETGAQFANVTYRGGAQAITDMLGGRLDLNFGTTAILLPQIQQGKLRALAFTGIKRSPDLPDVPTMAEAGLPQVSLNPDIWTGIVAPAGTPAEIVNKLNAAIADVLKSPEVRDRFAKMSFEPVIRTPQEFGAYMAEEAKKWPPRAQTAGLKPE